MSEQVQGPEAQSQAAPVSEKDRVIIFDTTLRVVEQAPGSSMSLVE